MMSIQKRDLPFRYSALQMQEKQHYLTGCNVNKEIERMNWVAPKERNGVGGRVPKEEVRTRERERMSVFHFAFSTVLTSFYSSLSSPFFEVSSNYTSNGNAIVSPIAGTTRDRRECWGRIASSTFKLMDTAGIDGDRIQALASNRIKSEKHELERRMMEQTLEAARRSDLVCCYSNKTKNDTPMESIYVLVCN